MRTFRSVIVVEWLLRIIIIVFIFIVAIIIYYYYPVVFIIGRNKYLGNRYTHFGNVFLDFSRL